MAPRNPKRVLALAILIFLAPLAAALGEGFYYEATTLDQNEKGKERSRMLVRGWIDGGGAKIEFADQKGTMFGEGTYLLTENGGETLYLVNPKEKAYSKWDLEEMFATMGALLESTGPLFDLDFSNATSQKLGEEDGESILGYPTRRYKWRSGYDMKMSVIGMKRQYNVDMLQEFWVTDRIDDEGFKVWLRPDRMKTGSEQFDQLLTTEMGKIEGFPLRSVTHTTMTTGKGKEQKSVSTMEVTVLRREPVPASTFALPQGYEERPFLPGMTPPAQGEGAQTSQRGQGAERGEGAEESEEGGPLKGLKGVFGKKKKDE